MGFILFYSEIIKSFDMTLLAQSKIHLGLISEMLMVVSRGYSPIGSTKLV